MADVSGILLDQMDDDVARLDLRPMNVDRRVEVQIGVDGPRMGDLTVPGAPGLGHDRVVGHRLVEVKIWVFLRAVEPRQLRLPLEHPARPGVLDPGEMTDQAQQGHRRGRDRSSGQLLGGQPLALELEGHPIAVEVFRENGFLTSSRLDRLSGVAAGLRPHAIKAHVRSKSTRAPSQQANCGRFEPLTSRPGWVAAARSPPPLTDPGALPMIPATILCKSGLQMSGLEGSCRWIALSSPGPIGIRPWFRNRLRRNGTPAPMN